MCIFFIYINRFANTKVHLYIYIYMSSLKSSTLRMNPVSAQSRCHRDQRLLRVARAARMKHGVRGQMRAKMHMWQMHMWHLIPHLHASVNADGANTTPTWGPLCLN